MPQSSIGLNWKVFGYVVKSIRQMSGKSQREFAADIPGLSSPTLCRIERGGSAEIGPYLSICKALDIHPYEIMEVGQISVEQFIENAKQVEDA